MTYSKVGDLRDTKGYIEHPIPDQVFRTKISDMDHWSLLLNVKHRFGNQETRDCKQLNLLGYGRP